jgi:hypothetical protein
LYYFYHGLLRKDVYGCCIFTISDLYFILIGGQGFGSYDVPSKRMPSFPLTSASRARYGSQQQLEILSKSTRPLATAETPLSLRVDVSSEDPAHDRFHIIHFA